MVEALDDQLAAWTCDADIAAVAIRGLGGKAFCAGGDVRAFGMLPTPQERTVLARRFFSVEYRLNHRIATYPKPYLALMDGITMGGGLGLSAHGSFRVVTERSLLAMPETVLGLFPDVGASAFLDRCPGEVGLYLGVTGERLGAADALHARLATHVVAGARMDALLDELARAPDLGAAAIADTLGRHAVSPEAGRLAGRQADIDRLFAGDTVEEIVAALETDGGALATEALAVLRRASPTSVKVTLRLLRESRGRSLATSLPIEYGWRSGQRAVTIFRRAFAPS